jgi:hypothetical protein
VIVGREKVNSVAILGARRSGSFDGSMLKKQRSERVKSVAFFLHWE